MSAPPSDEQGANNGCQGYHGLVRNAPIGIYMSAPEGGFMAANPALARMLGYTSPEKLEDAISDISAQVYAHPEDEKEFKRLLRDQGEVMDYECQWVRRDGSRFWVSNSVHAIRDQEGEIRYYQGFVVDITGRKQTEEKLRESMEYLAEEQARLQTITDAMGEGLYVMDASGRITFANPAAASLLGYNREELLGQVGHDMFHYHLEENGNRSGIENCPFFQTVLQEQSYFNKEWFQRKDGEVFPVEVSSRPIVEQGEVVAAVTVFMDISKRENAETRFRENERFLSSMIESIQEGISALDPDLTIKYVNGVMERWYQKNAPLVGKKCYQAYHDREEPCPDCPALRCMQTGNLESEEAPGLPGSNQWLEVFSHPMKDPETGEITGVVEFVQDITERKQAREERDRLNRELKEIIAERDKFLSIIAHDLKSPIYGLSNLFQEMSRNLEDFTREDIQNILFESKRSTSNVHALLMNLLEWSRMQRGHIQYEPENFSLKSLVQENLKLFKETAESRNIKVWPQVDQGLRVYADRQMLGTVLRNLLSNAVKFAYNGGEVWISADFEGEQIKVAVSDTGPGLDAKTAAGIFKIDQKTVVPGTTGEKGTGLGLLLCKEFVEKHGGRIWVESESGRGSTFYFTLPTDGESMDSSKQRQ